MAKTGGALILDTNHPLIRNPRVCVAFQEGSGNPRDLARPSAWVQRVNAPGWTTNADGVCGRATAANQGWRIGTDVAGLTPAQMTLPTGACTVVMVRRKTDTTLRGAAAFYVNATARQQLTAYAPWSDGIVTWDYGGQSGANRLSWPAGAGGYVASTALEYWVFVAGPTGMSIYLNSGTPKARQVTPVTRATNQVGGGDFTAGFIGNHELYLNHPEFGDLVEEDLFMVLGTEWTDAEVTTWLANPYAFLISGVLPALTTPIVATLPAEPGTPGGVSAMPADALDGGTDQVNAIDGSAVLQSKLNAMGPGSTLRLEAGGLFTNAGATGYGGSIELPQISGIGSNWAQVISTRDAFLPPSGTRINPVTDAGNLARIMNVGTAGALTARDAHNGAGAPCRGIRIRGLEVFNDPTFDSTSVTVAVTIPLGWGASSGSSFRAQGNPGSWSSRFIIDRCWVHGAGFNNRGGGGPNNHQGKGIWINANDDVRVCDCVVEGYQSDGDDTTAVYAMGSRGPIHVENTYLCATGMGFYMGGGTAFYEGGSGPSEFPGGGFTGLFGGFYGGDIIIPTNVIVRRCTSEKLNKWIHLFTDQQVAGLTVNPEFDTRLSASTWQVVKPPFELKMGRKVLFDACTIVNGYSWAGFTFDAIDPQDMQANSVDPNNTSNGLRRQVIEDVTVRYTIANGVSQFMQIQSATNPIRRLHVHDNLAPNIQRNRYPSGAAGIIGAGLYLSVGGQGGPNDIEDVVFEHNTLLCDAFSWVIDGQRASIRGDGKRARFKNNIWGYGATGPQCNTINNGQHITPAILTDQFVDVEIDHDVLINGPIAPSFFGDPATRTPYGGTPYSGYDSPTFPTGTFILPGHQEDAIIDWNTGVISGGVLATPAADGKPYGADLVALAAAQAGNTIGQPPGNPRVGAGRGTVTVF